MHFLHELSTDDLNDPMGQNAQPFPPQVTSGSHFPSVKVKLPAHCKHLSLVQFLQGKIQSLTQIRTELFWESLNPRLHSKHDPFEHSLQFGGHLTHFPSTFENPIIQFVHATGLLASHEAPQFDGQRTHLPFEASTNPNSHYMHFFETKSQLMQFFWHRFLA